MKYYHTQFAHNQIILNNNNTIFCSLLKHYICKINVLYQFYYHSSNLNLNSFSNIIEAEGIGFSIR